jgi:hypothetical protein
MKEIAISFTPDELRELAKQLYLGGFFLLTCDYENKAMVKEIFNRVCATGMSHAPETGGFREGGFMETLFTISPEVDDECAPVIELYGDDCVEQYLPYVLADRDFEEQYKVNDPYTILNDPELLKALKALQAKYIKESETYGVTHLRLEK